MHPETAAWLQDLDDLDDEPTASPELDEDKAGAAEGFQSAHILSFASLPTEVVLHIAAQLTLPATASLMQTCTHLRSLCLKVYKWEPHAGGYQAIKSDRAKQHYRLQRLPLSGSSAGSLNGAVQSHLAEVVAEAADAANSQRYSWCPVPGQRFLRRVFSSGSKVAEPAWLSLLPQVSCEGHVWLYIKTKTAAETNLRGCQPAFQHTHNAVRSQLYMLWLAGEIEAGLLLQRMLLKMTRLSWSKTYEALHNAFVHVADCIALDLRTDCLADNQSGKPEHRVTLEQLSWNLVLREWQHYVAWLTKACSLCVRLGECISAERAAEMLSRGKADTPTLFDVGKAAFRSQVLLAFGLRAQLQAEWKQLRLSARNQRQSVEDAHTLMDVTRLLQELDVADDGTRPSSYHTQEQMREGFGLHDHRHEFAQSLLQAK